MLIKTNREFTCKFPMDKDQKEFLHDNILNYSELMLTTGNPHMLVDVANTGAGKTFVISNYLIPSLVRLNIPNVNPLHNFLVVAPPREVRDDIWETLEHMDYKTIDGKTVCVYEEKALLKVANGNNHLKGDINILVVTNAWFNTNHKKLYKNPNIKFDCIINDEAHYANGVPHIDDMKISTGAKNNQAKLTTFKNLEALRKDGSLVIQFTATPTVSQTGITHHGGMTYLQLPVMPFNPLTMPFVHFLPSTLDDSYNTIFTWYKNHVSVIKDLQNVLTQQTWDLVTATSPLRKMMPAVAIRVGAVNAKEDRAKTWDDLETIVRNDCTIEDWDLVDLIDTLEYDGVYTKNTLDAIKMANSPAKENRPTMFVVKNKFLMGANLPRLAVSGVVRNPSQQLVENNWVQFYARTSRLPYFRNHEDARNYIYSLPIDYQQKYFLCLLYVYMSSAVCIVLTESTLLSEKVVKAYSDGKWTVEQGLGYFLDNLKTGYYNTEQFGSSVRANRRYDDYIKSEFCEGCPKGPNGLPNCLMNVYSVYCQQYGDVAFEEFMDVQCDMLDGEHIDSDRNNNALSNRVTVCANVHRVKTALHKDYLTVYKNGQRVIDKN
jgi:hypothetical protein